MKENADLNIISTRDIDFENREYQISFPEESTYVDSAIEKTGVITPILVLPEKPHTVIDGFRRIHYAVRSKIESIPAYILEIPPRRALLVSIYNNLSRGLNLVEKAVAVSKMFQMRFKEEEIVNTMEVLGLGKSKKIENLCLKIAEQDKKTKMIFVDHSLSMKTVGYFLDLSQEGRRWIISLLQKRKITESSLRNLVEAALLSELKFGEIPLDQLEKAETPEDAMRILKRKISPGLSKLEEEFRKFCSQLALPPNARIKTDPFFEREEIGITIEAKKPVDIKNALDKLQSALGRGDFDRLFQLTAGKLH